MISVILRNIISNAVKFSYQSGELIVEIRERDNSHEVVIKDSGLGMDKEKLDNLFKFDRNHSTGTNGESGTGIGLMLSKEFIDKLGYTISVYSTPGKGSTFVLTL